MRRVDFFYGLGSRYSYLAATQIDALAARTGATFEWRPLFSGELIARKGQSPFDGAPVSGQYDWTYRRRDAERWAAYYGVPYIEPAPFALPPARYAAAAAAAARWSRTREMSLALFHAIFGTGRGVGDVEIAEAARAAGLDPDALLAQIEDGAARAARNVADAAALGAFGVPTFAFDGEIIWGNDRLVLLEHALLQGTER